MDKTKDQTVRDLTHIPPHSVEMEQQLLGALLKDADALNKILDFFNESGYFYVPKHNIIFQAILGLYEKNEPYDLALVSEALTKSGELDKIGGRYYLLELVESVATSANVAKYADEVYEKALLRWLIGRCTSIVEECHSRNVEVSPLLDRAAQNLFTLSEKRIRKGFVPLSSLLPKTFEQIEEYQQLEGGVAGLPTGYEKLDTMTSGLHEGEFIVVAGRPSMGKTAFALNIAEYVAIERSKSVGIFSIEMSADQLALRMLCGNARLSQHTLRTGKLRDNDYVKLSRAVGPLSEARIFIDDSPFLSTLEMRAKARRLKSQHNIDLLIIDYIQMMHSTSRTENRQQEMAMISRSIKGMAKELNIPVIAVSQLSRMVETRGGDKRPQLSDLRESGAIEQDADLVMFVYRPEFYLSHRPKDDPKRMEVEGRAEIIVAKQRNGPTGVLGLTFVKEYTRFENLAYDKYEPPPEDFAF